MKYALIIACNFQGTPNELRGCINDALNMRTYLLAHGFQPENVVLSTDDDSITHEKDQQPTRSNVFRLIAETTAKLQKGDLLLFHISSHGMQVKDKNGDERDGKDEAIVVSGLNGPEVITDDELRKALVNTVPPGVVLRAVLDTCCSGTALDLPFLYKKGSVCNRENTQPLPGSHDVLSISGCMDNGTSADAIDSNNLPAGAMTSALLDVLQASHTSLSWRDLVAMVRHVLKQRGFSQVPQLALSDSILLQHIVDL